MFQKNILGIVFISTFVFASSAYAGKAELTTFYPAAYGEYTNLKSTGNSYFATTSGFVGIGTTSPGAKLQVVGTAIIPGLFGQIQTVSPSADTSTASTSFVDMNGMSITLTTRASSKLLISWNAGIYQNAAGAWVVTQALLDGVLVGTYQGGAYGPSGTVDSMGGNAVATVGTAGSHTVKIQWKVAGGTAANNPTASPTFYGRTLTVTEVYQ